MKNKMPHGFAKKIPLSLYIHIPFCVKKCPYCDFNSFVMPRKEIEHNYFSALLADLKQDASLTSSRPLNSIYIGGGTPSLFPPAFYEKLLNEISKFFSFIENIEISIEINPGTLNASQLQELHAIGINRLSIGVQSFDDNKLKMLQRIHSANDAITIIQAAKTSGFDNFNIDLMHGVPQQTVQEAITDLQTALSFSPPHLSWYQLTLEPETPFYTRHMTLPDEDIIIDIQNTGENLLTHWGYQHYEISAFSQPEYQCRHNLNYWQFGDYLGIGAGAHSKITTEDCQIMRLEKIPDPLEYITAKTNYCSKKYIVSPSDISFEFMLNALRLTEGVATSLFQERTGLAYKTLHPQLKQAQINGFIEDRSDRLKTTKHGQQFLNNCLELFMDMTN